MVETFQSHRGFYQSGIRVSCVYDWVSSMAFMADKLNAAKSYFDIADYWHVHYKHAKTFQSGLDHYNGVDKENRVAVIALHKGGARIF